MSEHDERQDHETKAAELEYEAAEMQERTDALEKDIEDAGEEWERRKADDNVPGAAGEPEQADGPEPEAEYPNKRGGDDSAGDHEELDFGRSLAEDDGEGDEEDEEG